MASVGVLTFASEGLLWLLGEDRSEGRGAWRNRHRVVQESSKGQQGLGRVCREVSRGQILGASGRYRAGICWEVGCGGQLRSGREG